MPSPRLVRLALVLLLAATGPAWAQDPRAEALPGEAELRELEATFAIRLTELVEILRAGNELDRGAAVEELGRIGLPAHRTLAGLADQEPWELRCAAVQALTKIGLSPVLPTLLAYFKDANWSVREAVATGLGRFRDAAGRDALLGALDDPVWRVKVAALEALAARREPAALGRILALADSADEDVRYAALEALVAFDPPEAKARLLPLLADADPEVRRLGMRGVLGRDGNGDPRALLPLLRDAHLGVRIEALQAILQRLGADLPEVLAAVEELIGFLALPPYDPRYAYASGFLEQHAQALAQPLCRGLRHADPGVRRETMRIVSDRKVEAAGPDLVAIHGTLPPDGREEVLHRIVNLKTADAAFFVRVAREGNPSEQAVAMRELGAGVTATSPQAREAAAVLLERLSHPEPELRKAAARALYASRLEVPVPALVERLKTDGDPGAFSETLNVLMAQPGEPVTTALLGLYDGLPEGFARVLVAQAVGQRTDRAAEVWVRRKFADEDPAVRQAMIGAAQGRPLVFVDELLAVAGSDAVARNRAAALGLISGLRDPRVFDLLVTAARDADLNVRDVAVKGLSARSDPKAIPPLLEAATAGEDILRREALDALAGYDDERVKDLLIQCAVADESESIRSHAVLLLQRVRDPRVVDALLPRVQQETAIFVKNNLAYTLGMIGDRRALAAVVTLTKDPEPMVRATAALVLGLFPPPRPMDTWRGMMKDPDPGVRLSVVEALAWLAAADSRDVLFGALLDADERVRRRALAAVGAFGEPAARQAALQAAFKEVERQAPEGEERWFRAGLLLMRHDLADVAHLAFTAVLSTPPHDTAADAASRFYLGNVDLERGDFAAAAAHLEAAADRYPVIGATLNVPVETIRGYAHAARALDALRERKEARAHHEIAAAETLMKSSPELLNLLAWTMVEHDLDLPLALELGERALRAAPESPAILDTVGWIHYQLGHGREALELLRRACRGMPDDPDLGFHLARVLMANGQRAEAFQTLKHAVEREPGLGPQAREASEFRSVRGNEEFEQIVKPGPKFTRED